MELDLEDPVVRGTAARIFPGAIRTGTRCVPAAAVRAGARHPYRQRYAPGAPSGARARRDEPDPASGSGT
ncbi:hypothetical protein ACIBBB_06610 [Streptomyces sp. NPDC051217]|uniref:hypothetical protein n=1 Tax=Streptomyces sp. NPDC051217 TaxID=3365644 RepID=UPI0037AA821D